MKKIVERPKEFSQVCVWPATYGAKKDTERFISFMKEKFDVRVFYLEEIKTFPDKDKNGKFIKDTGGRIDTIFAIHNDDVRKFSLPRIHAGIRWIEDVFANMDRIKNVMYPEYLRAYCTWDGTVLDFIPFYLLMK